MHRDIAVRSTYPLMFAPLQALCSIQKSRLFSSALENHAVSTNLANSVRHIHIPAAVLTYNRIQLSRIGLQDKVEEKNDIRRSNPELGPIENILICKPLIKRNQDSNSCKLYFWVATSLVLEIGTRAYCTKQARNADSSSLMRNFRSRG